MKDELNKLLFKGFRFPPEIIQYAIWLYFTFPLSFRDVKLLRAQRGIQVSHESIRTWCYRFGPALAGQLRRKRRKPSDKWHLDEVFVTINRRRYYLWRGPHQGIQQQIPVLSAADSRPASAENTTRIMSTPILKGLHHSYSRIAHLN